MAGFLKFQEFYDPYQMNLYSVSNYEHVITPPGTNNYVTQDGNQYVTQDGDSYTTQ